MDSANRGNVGEGASNPSGSAEKQSHRHSAEQIQRMEEFFKSCPNPDEVQREQLGRDLHLEPRQIKIWFQNKRAQMKRQNKRSDSVALRAAIENLEMENQAFEEALTNPRCPNCDCLNHDADEVSKQQYYHELLVENIRLREERQRLATMLGLPDEYDI